MGPLCELVSTQLYDLILGKSVVPRTGSRTWYKNVKKMDWGFKAWTSSHERHQSGSWFPGAACELTSVPGCCLRGGGSAHCIAQNHLINTPERVAHRVSHYCSRMVVCHGPYPASPFHLCIPPMSRPISPLPRSPPPFPECGSAHIAQNHQINLPYGVAHRVAHYCSRLLVGRGPYHALPHSPPCIPTLSRPSPP